EKASYLNAFQDALLMEERLLVQKAKIDWLKLGDANTAYFHKVVKSAIGFYYLFCNRLSEDAAVSMIRDVTDKEIRDAMFSLGDNKAPGPDGYTAAFFKEAWGILSADICKAIKEFFTNGILLKELNHTIIALIPKVATPLRINDYRPISCCNVLFKCISKIISNRLKDSLSELVSLNQSAFVPGRRISDNILLTQELMHNYHLDRGPARCAFKVDIQKAYDTVDWNFLNDSLIGFGFHPRMIGWIMECVKTTSFSISINGCLHGYFKGKRGLRQGDPLSPYLFTLVMEVLTLMLNRRVRQSDSFTFHRYCSQLNIINLCFADDLFLFAHGDVDSTRVIMEALEEFKNASGLTPSLPKSTAYFCNVLNYVKIGILGILPFEEGTLPVKHLGVPLVPSWLLYRDCSELMERIKSRISDWKNKTLSFAGRAQLIRYVLGSMHLYWASVFILPSRLMLELEQVLRGFLWCQGEFKRGKVKVAWDAVCLPKREGGLGIRRLEEFNKALITSHIWSFLSSKESLWVKWIHSSILLNVAVPILSKAADGISLRTLDNLEGDFLVAKVWDCIRHRNNEVTWFHVVWFAHQIPRHAINLWLVIKRKLKTQDKLRQWDVSSDTNLNLLQCPLCETQPDSHEHLFFECRFSLQVWEHLKHFTCISNVPSDLNSIMDFITPLAKMRSARSIIFKLVFAASCYFIWQERNFRLFKKTKRTREQVIEAIKNTVRLKLLSCSFKKTLNVMSLLTGFAHASY
ncbi:hypothetical protein Tco_1063004, partial [Tanacetum coccineum]